MNERTLSSSDFGFHNALKRANGQIVFLDFEYFGWDDPAKMISDFLLHPQIYLRANLKSRFFKEMLNCFDFIPNIDKRIMIVYPLFGLKWCLILLNEFVSADLLRRHFAESGEIDQEQLRAEQLAKARIMLLRIVREHESFPY